MKRTPPPAHPASPRSAASFLPRRWHGHLDFAGAGLSLACALHCATLPLLLAFVPTAMMALRSFQHPAHGAMTLLLVLSRWEWVFALLASAVALISTVAGARRHHHRLPLLMAECGAALLLAASLIEPLKESLLGHALATCVGGLLLAMAHWRNRRLLRATPDLQPTHAQLNRQTAPETVRR